jgi:penicillin-binding protein 2
MIFQKNDKPRLQSNPLAPLALLLTVVLGFYGARLYYLQVSQYDQYATLSNDNRLQPSKIPAVRGELRASDGTLLATSRDAVALIYKGGEVKQLERIAKLAGVPLPLPPIDPKIGEVVLKKDVPPASILALEEWLSGQDNLELRYRVQRYYPSGMAGNLLGYMEPANENDLKPADDGTPSLYDRDDLVPQAGLEAGLEAQLTGVPGERLQEMDARGRVVRERVVRPAERGHTVTLTILPKLQAATEQAILEAKDDINKRNARNGIASVDKARGAIVALNPKTGQILALAVGPKYDPNWLSTSPRDPKAVQALTDTKYLPMWNRAVKIFEPGSTFKLVTASALLEAGFGNRVFQCYSAWRWGGRAWRNWNRMRDMGPMDARGAIANSCNTWYFQSVVAYGPEAFGNLEAKRAAEFGFGEPTGVELTGESGGELIGPKISESQGRVWNPGSSLNYAIGQEFRATPLQIARMLATIVGDGKRPQLTVVKSIDGKPVPLKPMTQLSGQYWSMLKQGMVQTTQVGTAKEVLALKEFPILTGGKTGTAQTAQGAHRDHAWYMGYGPVKDPNLVVVAFFENGVEGSGVALPAVKKVMAAYWGIKLDSRGKVVKQSVANKSPSR